MYANHMYARMCEYVWMCVCARACVRVCARAARTVSRVHHHHLTHRASWLHTTQARAACAAVVAENGLRGLFRGLGVTLVKAVPVNAAGMALLECMRSGW